MDTSANTKVGGYVASFLSGPPIVFRSLSELIDVVAASGAFIRHETLLQPQPKENPFFINDRGW